eukprot:35779-Hanusia_phi.AAC.1
MYAEVGRHRTENRRKMITANEIIRCQEVAPDLCEQMGSTCRSRQVAYTLLLLASLLQESDAFAGACMLPVNKLKGKSSSSLMIRMDMSPSSGAIQRRILVKWLGILPFMFSTMARPSGVSAEPAGKISVTDKKEMLKLKVRFTQPSLSSSHSNQNQVGLKGLDYLISKWDDETTQCNYAEVSLMPRVRCVRPSLHSQLSRDLLSSKNKAELLDAAKTNALFDKDNKYMAEESFARLIASADAMAYGSSFGDFSANNEFKKGERPDKKTEQFLTNARSDIEQERVWKEHRLADLTSSKVRHQTEHSRAHNPLDHVLPELKGACEFREMITALSAPCGSRVGAINSACGRLKEWILPLR